MRRGSSGVSDSQQRSASICVRDARRRSALTIMSPREMSISSSSSRVIDCSATARGSELAADLDVLDARASRPDGSTVTASPTRDLARFDAAHEAAVVVQFGIGRLLRPADVLHREAEGLGVLGVGGRRRSRGSRAASGPRTSRGASPRSTTMSPFERRHRDEAHVLDAQLGARRRGSRP